MIEKLAENPNSDALAWLLEMELIQNPNVLNAIILNVFKTVRGLKDAEFVIDTRQKKLLIYLELKKFHEWFFKKDVEDQILEMLNQTLPNFKFRVVFDRTILEKAIKLAKQ